MTGDVWATSQERAANNNSIRRRRRAKSSWLAQGLLLKWVGGTETCPTIPVAAELGIFRHGPNRATEPAWGKPTPAIDTTTAHNQTLSCACLWTRVPPLSPSLADASSTDLVNRPDGPKLSLLFALYAWAKPRSHSLTGRLGRVVCRRTSKERAAAFDTYIIPSS